MLGISPRILGAGITGVLIVGLAGCGGAGQAPTGGASSAAATAAPVAASTPATATASTVAAVASAAPPAEFAICQSCHSVQPGQNLVGPSLAGVFGRKAGSLAGYPYSDAVKGLDVTWDEASLDTWLTNPSAMAPGTKMAFAGYADPAQRKAVIAYLKTLQ